MNNNYPQKEINTCELVSTRIKHTRKTIRRIKHGSYSYSFQGTFSTDQITYGLTGTGSGLPRISFKADCKNKNQFLFIQAMAQLFES